MQGEVFGVEVFLDAFAAAFVAVPASFKASEGGAMLESTPRLMASMPNTGHRWLYRIFHFFTPLEEARVLRANPSVGEGQRRPNEWILSEGERAEH